MLLPPVGFVQTMPPCRFFDVTLLENSAFSPRGICLKRSYLYSKSKN
jgi:hypothetical protein